LRETWLMNPLAQKEREREREREGELARNG
jgi:hypothetical protein